MKRTDAGKIEYPPGLNASDRRFCRRLIVAVKQSIERFDDVVVACSGGIDSTVLAHAVWQSCNILGGAPQMSVAYVNHNLRPKENKKEIDHIKKFSPAYILDGSVKKGSGLQARARDVRYAVLFDLCLEITASQFQVALLTAHTANDLAETRLFNILTGRPKGGIVKELRINTNIDIFFMVRPLLSFTRKDIERYAKCMNLTWCEDSSNSTDNYTRNKIRHHLIPWVEENINPGIVKILSHTSE